MFYRFLKIRNCHTLSLVAALFVLSAMIVFVDTASAHNVSRADRALVTGNSGLHLWLYIWLGAKHMVTGYDHLLFLLGVIFYLRKVREIALFVSLFALGHTITLISGVLAGLDVNAYAVDAVIGLSVTYKGFDNLGGFRRLFGSAPDERLAVFVFGLFHGLGLASKLQDLGLASEGLIGNLISFNVGVELGQFVALLAIVFTFRWLIWGNESVLIRNSVNGSLVVAGFALAAYQLARM